MPLSALACARRGALFLAFGLLLLGLPALAGEINDVDGPAIRGYDPVAYFEAGRPVAGSEQFTAVHKGATFRFASAANRDAFRAMPEKYAPQYGGFCSYAAARGYKAVVDPAAWAIVEGKLYLNYSKSVQTSWDQDRAGYIRKANANWPKVVSSTEIVR